MSSKFWSVKGEAVEMTLDCVDFDLADDDHGPDEYIRLLWHVVFVRGEDEFSLEKAIVFPDHGLSPFEVDLQGEFGDLMREMDFGNRGNHAYLDVYQCESGCRPRAEIRGTHKGQTDEVFLLGDLVEGIKHTLTSAAIAAGLPEDRVRFDSHIVEPDPDEVNL